ncbi:MAG: 4Fe-4S dicluster domain-containing protein, partial [Raoultibacter sp.]
ALIVSGALEGVVVASALVFGLQLVFALVLRRAFCGWVCAAGGLQELAATVNGKRTKRGWRTYIKYVIWVPWIISIIACAWIAGGFTVVDPLYHIPGGISIESPLGLGIYFGIVALFFIPSLFLGRRAMCQCICWMAPFMVIGEKIGGLLHVPQLHIASKPDACITCGKCTKVCPMSLDVQELLGSGKIADVDCIQCAECVDVCPKDVLAVRFGK